ncbi:MAG: carboxylating nicotinate-nucleotide diphosphorylase [Arenicellaceae bacterium]|nr:carboxylating nicotinate-nucleotide diphosphorylase [Arenicellaceae bacterium]
MDLSNYPVTHAEEIRNLVSIYLAEDIGDGDLTAALVPTETVVGKIISREAGVLCGMSFANEVFAQVDRSIEIDWHFSDSDSVQANDHLCTISGSARSILTAERCVLNILQTLSGTASVTKTYTEKLKPYKTSLLDTRKTIPGLRNAQKYAVLCGGGTNHRIGLYDGILIKENHLRSGNTLEEVVDLAISTAPKNALVGIEVETIKELERALNTPITRVLLDDFTVEAMREAVAIVAGRIELEASGNVTLENIAEIAATGVNFISTSAIIKNLKALDLSLLFDY